MPVSGRPRPLSVARPAVGMPSTTVANANAVSSRCQLLRAPARLLYVSILAPSLNGFRNQLLHGVTTPLHACAVGTPIRVHLGLLVRLGVLCLGGVLPTATHAARYCPGCCTDRRTMSRIVVVHVANERAGRSATSRPAYSRPRGSLGRWRSTCNDRRIDARVLLGPGVAGAVVLRLLARALSMRRIHRGLGCKRSAACHGKRRCQENCFHTNLNID